MKKILHHSDLKFSFIIREKQTFFEILDDGCSAAAGSDQCSRSEGRILSRKKRTLTLPNNAAILLQSRLFIPQLPIGFYLVWLRVRFFIRYMFTESIM